MSKPETVLVLDSERKIIKGSAELLNRKIKSGADLRICTGFLHNEHIDLKSDDHQMIAETSTFQETVLIDGKWSAYFMTLRQPVALPDGFGLPNSLSLFLYNQNGQQALARVVMDGTPDTTMQKDSEESGMKKMHTISVFDSGTAGVSKNFIYDFEFYEFIVNNCYEEVPANDSDLLGALYRDGRGIKIAMKGLSEVMWGDTGHEDEIYIHCASSYHYTKDKLMITNTHPFVSVPADIPLTYKSRSFRYCWAVARTDGRVEIRSYHPFSGKWETKSALLDIRWFA